MPIPVYMLKKWSIYEQGQSYSIASALAKALIENGYAMPAENKAMYPMYENKGELNINGGTITSAGTQAAAIDDHVDPATATTEEVATKQNTILAALRGVGIIASS